MFFKIIAATMLAGMLGSPISAQPSPAPKLRPEMLVTTAWLAEHLQDRDLVVLCVGSTPEFCNIAGRLACTEVNPVKAGKE